MIWYIKAFTSDYANNELDELRHDERTVENKEKMLDFANKSCNSLSDSNRTGESVSFALIFKKEKR